MIGTYRACCRRLISFSVTLAMLVVCWSANEVNVQAKDASPAARLGQEFKLRIGRQVRLKREGLSVKFVAVKEDSRCPADVQCVWAGNAAVQIQVSLRGRHSKTLTLNSNNASAHAGADHYRGYQFKLVDLSPYPRTTQTTAKHNYVATLLVSKNRSTELDVTK